MKLILKSSRNWMLLAAISCFVAPPVCAQSEKGFAADSTWSKPFRDGAVVPADFQKEGIQSGPGSNLVCDSSSVLQAGLTDPRFDVAVELPGSDASGSWSSQWQQRFEGLDFARVLGSLAIVLGGYLGFVWLTRKFGTGLSQGLPQEVVEVLGQSPFGPRKSLQLVRLGSKLLLLLNNNDGTQTVGEITDPHEVEYLVSLCGGRKANRSAIAIRKASSAKPDSGPNSDLKKILRQLERATDGPGNGAVFEA